MLNWWEYLPGEAYRSWRQQRDRIRPAQGPAVPSWAPEPVPGQGQGLPRLPQPPGLPPPPRPPGGGGTVASAVQPPVAMPAPGEMERAWERFRADQQLREQLRALGLGPAGPGEEGLSAYERARRGGWEQSRALVQSILPGYEPDLRADPLSTGLELLFGLGQEYVGRPVAGALAALLNDPGTRATTVNALSYSMGGSPVPGMEQPYRAEQLAPARPGLEFRPAAEGGPLQRLAAAYQEAKRVEEARPELFPGEKGWTEGLVLNPVGLLGGGLLPPGSLQVVGPSMPALAAYERAARAVQAGTATAAQERLAQAVPAVMGAGDVLAPQTAAQVEALVREAQAAARAANPRFWPTAAQRSASRAEKVAQRRAYLRQVLGREPTAEELARGVAPGQAGATLPSWAPGPAGQGTLALRLPAPGGVSYAPSAPASVAGQGLAVAEPAGAVAGRGPGPAAEPSLRWLETGARPTLEEVRAYRDALVERALRVATPSDLYVQPTQAELRERALQTALLVSLPQGDSPLALSEQIERLPGDVTYYAEQHPEWAGRVLALAERAFPQGAQIPARYGGVRWSPASWAEYVRRRLRAAAGEAVPAQVAGPGRVEVPVWRRGDVLEFRAGAAQVASRVLGVPVERSALGGPVVRVAAQQVPAALAQFWQAEYMPVLMPEAVPGSVETPLASVETAQALGLVAQPGGAYVRPREPGAMGVAESGPPAYGAGGDLRPATREEFARPVWAETPGRPWRLVGADGELVRDFRGRALTFGRPEEALAARDRLYAQAERAGTLPQLEGPAPPEAPAAALMRPETPDEFARPIKSNRPRRPWILSSQGRPVTDSGGRILTFRSREEAVARREKLYAQAEEAGTLRSVPTEAARLGSAPAPAMPEQGAVAPAPTTPEEGVAPADEGVERRPGQDERQYEAELDRMRASFDAALAAGRLDEAQQTRAMIQLAVRNVGLERAMNQALWQATKLTPEQASEEAWQRTVEELEDRLCELQERYTREGLEDMVQGERRARPETTHAFGREIVARRGAFSRAEARRRVRDYWRRAQADVADRYAELLEEAGYTADELVGTSMEQRRRLLEELGQGRLLHQKGGRPAQIAGLSPERRGEVLLAAEPALRGQAAEAAQGALDAPGLDASRVYQTAQAIRAYHLDEQVEVPDMAPYPEDAARWLPDAVNRPPGTTGSEALEQGTLAGVPAPPGPRRVPTPEEEGLPRGWLPELPSNEAILARAYQGGRLAAALRALGRRYPELERVVSAGGLPADDPQVRAYLLRESIIADWNTAVTGAMARLRSLGSSRQLFDVDENELAHLPSRSPVAIYDLLERPKGYHLTPQQRRWIDALYRLTDEGRAAMLANGIDVPKRAMPEGSHYVGRRVLGRLDPESNTIEVGVIARGPGAGGGQVRGMAQVDEADLYGPMIGRRGEFELARSFDTQRAALEAGFRYLTPEETLQLNLQYIGRRIADERMKRLVLEEIPNRPLPVWQDEHGVWQVGGVRYGETQVPGPSLSDVAFLAKDVARLRGLLGQRAPGTVQRGAEFLASANAIPRLMMTTFDFGAAFGQLQTLMLSRPRQWARAVVEGATAFAGEDNFQRYLAQNAEVIAEASQHGLDLSPSEFTEAARWGQRLGLRRGTVEEAARSPLGERLHRGKETARAGFQAVAAPFSRMYEAQLTAAKIELYKALRPLATSSEDLDAIARHCNLMSLGLNVKRLGLGAEQRAVEAAVLYAPRMYRAALALLSDTAKGGMKGRLARESLGRMAVAGLLGYLGICALLGQEPELDPRSSRFMTIRVAGQHMSLGGVLYATTRTLLGMTLHAGQAATIAAKMALKLAPADEGWQAPMAKAASLARTWGRSRLSPALGALVDVGLGRDAAGRPVATGKPLELLRDTVGMRLMPIWLQSLAESEGRAGEKAARGAAEFLALRTFPVSARDERDELRERYARQAFQKAWAELDPRERSLVEKAHADLGELETRALEESAGWGSLWAQYELDVERAREGYQAEIAALGEDLRAGRISGNEYRDEVSRREALMAETRRIVAAGERYQGLDEFEGGPGRTALSAYLDRYYRASEAATDPRTGRVDMELRAQLLDLLERETPPEVLAQAREYLDRNRDPEYAQAQAEWREYMRIPKYLGLSEQEARQADHAAEMIAAIRAQLPGMPFRSALALYAQKDPYGAALAAVAERLRNPARRLYYAQHPLLARFYGDLTWEELSAVQLPEMLGAAVGE